MSPRSPTNAHLDAAATGAPKHRVGTVVDARLLGRALGFAALVVAALAVPVWVLGLVPADHESFFALGIGASLFAAMLAIVVHGRFLDGRAAAAFAHDGRLMAGRLQSLLAIAFAAKLAVLVLGGLVLRQAGVKFEALATFCITFAAVSLVSQLATAAYLSRAMNQRPIRTQPALGDRNSGTDVAATDGSQPTEQDHRP